MTQILAAGGPQFPILHDYGGVLAPRRMLFLTVEHLQPGPQELTFRSVGEFAHFVTSLVRGVASIHSAGLIHGRVSDRCSWRAFGDRFKALDPGVLEPIHEACRAPGYGASLLEKDIRDLGDVGLNLIARQPYLWMLRAVWWRATWSITRTSV